MYFPAPGTSSSPRYFRCRIAESQSTSRHRNSFQSTTGARSTRHGYQNWIVSQEQNYITGESKCHLSQITSADSYYDNLITSCVFFQDVIIHNKKLSRKDQDLQSLASSNTKGIRSLSKESQEKLEAYQNLFYLLQTNPVYLAKLIFEMPQSRSTNFMESVILTLYNYASNTREEYLLLKLFETALREEIL